MVTQETSLLLDAWSLDDTCAVRAQKSHPRLLFTRRIARTLRAGAGAAIVFGLLATFVAAVQSVAWIRLDLLLDPDPSWAPMRLLLALGVVAFSGLAGLAAASLCLFLARSALANREPVGLPFRRSTILALGAAALVVGVALRLAGAETIPGSLWVDDVSEVAPALGLSGGISDAAAWSYPVPFIAGKWGGSVGTLYLELFRLCLKVFGTTMLGVRAPSILGGILSLFTGALLGRAFLPAGGGALTALVLAGMRWQIIVSHWGWNAIALAPILDLSCLLMLEARRRLRVDLAALSGVIAGLGAHIHLSAWIGGGALGLWAAWPSQSEEPFGRRARRAVMFAAAFALVVVPLLLDHPADRYLSRLGASTPAGDGRSLHPAWQPLETAAAALTGPWWTPDPFPRHDIPGKSRLGWVLGLALGAGLLRALLTPRSELSGLLIASAAAAFATSLLWGRSGTPNSYRYSYLTTLAAVAAARGILWLISAVRPARRRAAAMLLVGLCAVSGAIAARDALVLWPSHPQTFAAFYGQDSLVGRAAARWERYGEVDVEPSLAHSAVVVETVRRYRLDPDADRQSAPGVPGSLSVRIVRPEAQRTPSERVVERVQDGWGKEWAVVLAEPGRRNPLLVAARASSRRGTD